MILEPYSIRDIVSLFHVMSASSEVLYQRLVYVLIGLSCLRLLLLRMGSEGGHVVMFALY
jgi:hypothetical protein